MSGTAGLVLLAVVALAAIGLDLVILWTWRALRQAKVPQSPAPAAKAIPSAGTAARPPRVVRWILAIEAAISGGYATIRRLTRLTSGMLRSEPSLLRAVVVLASFLNFGIYAQAPSLDFVHVFPPNPWN